MVDYLNSQKGDTMAEETTTVQTDADLEASIADVSLTDPNVDLGKANADDTAAQNGTEEAAATTDDKTAKTDDAAGEDAKTTEATADPNKDDPSKATDDPNNPDGKTTGDEDPAAAEEQRRQAAQQSWKTRQQSRQQIAEQLDQAYGPETEQELVDKGLDPTDAKVEALRQEYAYNQERTRVSELNANMRAEAVEVFHDFPVFDPKSKDFDADFAREAETAYKQAARLQTIEVGRNPDGTPIEVVSNADVSLYDHYQRMYNVYTRGATKGAQQGQRQAQDMMSRTENPGGSSSTTGPAPGSLEEMEARLGDVVIT